MVLLIDNYDSFSYNLYQLVASFEPDLLVKRNDKITPAEIKKLKPSAIFLSPGPGRPENAGNMPQIIAELKGIIPIFGVCLGHQAICQSYGIKVSYAKKLMHGKSSKISYTPESILFKGMQNPFTAARYHSLAADEKSMPLNCLLKITARSENGEIMATEDAQNKVFGVQFHPESVLTPEGASIIKNFLDFIK